MVGWFANIIVLIVTIILLCFLYIGFKSKSDMQKGIMGLYLTIVGSLVIIIVDAESFIGYACGYILVALGTFLVLWATIFAKKRMS